MIQRKIWINLIENSWKEKNILWLTGVRRVGKTFLCKTLPDILYFDCELPRIRQQLADTEIFLENHHNKRLVLDEIHRLMNPSEILKIAADHFPSTKIIATGSSALEASRQFKDTLTGRKKNILLTPMLFSDLIDFKRKNIVHRLKYGGLPDFFLEKSFPEKDFQEWIDSFWAKDIQQLFRLQQQYSFQKFVEMIFTQSGQQFEASRFAAPCEVSRTTIGNYLSVLENTWIANVIRPFSSRKSIEITSAPKVYAFDTGFVSYFKGWQIFREDDYGLLWEHLVLNELQGRQDIYKINYWRDKRAHEIDFIITKPGFPPLTIECKWKDNHFNPKNLISFRKNYPNGNNYVVACNVKEPYIRKISGLKINFINLQSIANYTFFN